MNKCLQCHTVISGRKERCMRCYKRWYYVNNNTRLKSKARQYYYNNREQVLKMVKAYEAQNREQVKERRRLYYEHNRARIRNKKRTHYELHREQILQKNKEWWKNNPNKIRDNMLKKKYGLTLEGYNTMLQEQNGVCAICYRPPRRKPLAVDHCHHSKKIRGLLCDNCNRAIGLIGNDVKRYERAIEYIHKSLVT